MEQRDFFTMLILLVLVFIGMLCALPEDEKKQDIGYIVTGVAYLAIIAFFYINQ